MKLLENKIITQIINNLNEDFNTIKNLLIQKPQYKKEFNDFYLDYRELLGKQIWLNDKNFEFEKELIFEFLDLEKDIKDFIYKIQ